MLKSYRYIFGTPAVTISLLLPVLTSKPFHDLLEWPGIHNFVHNVTHPIDASQLVNICLNIKPIWMVDKTDLITTFSWFQFINHQLRFIMFQKYLYRSLLFNINIYKTRFKSYFITFNRFRKATIKICTTNL